MMKILFALALSCLCTAAVAQSTVPVAPAKTAVAQIPASPAGKSSMPLEGEPTLAKIDERGTLRVGVAVNAPWVMHNENGDLTGYSIDIANKLAASMGWKLEFVPTSWPRLMLDLRTDKFDVIISGLSITPQRARFVQFTTPVGEYDIDAVVNRHKFGKVNLAEFANKTHAKVAVRKGELTVDFARSALPNADLVEIDDEDAAIADVRSGKLDAYVAEAPMPHLLQKMYPDQLRALDDPIARTAHGFAVRKNDIGLMRVLNAWIVFEQASGWLKERSLYWFEDTTWASVL